MVGYILADECPFQIGDEVECDHTHQTGIVVAVTDQHVFVENPSGEWFYRTWTHDLDRVTHKRGGGLVRVKRHD